MPRVKPLTAVERQNQEFLAALRAGQARKKERDSDTAQIIPSCKERTYYTRLKNPEKFLVEDLRELAKRYDFSDRQLCLMIGVEYNGATPA